MGELVAAFMQESSIRWGELAAGLLMVGCSVALVVTFWESIARVWWIRFGVFSAIVSAVFGIGLYTERKWKLPTTSRGALLVAVLLVPMHFLVMALLGGTGDLFGVVCELAIILWLGWLVLLAGRVLTPLLPAPLVLAVAGGSACQILIAHVGVGGDATRGLLLGGVPLVVYCAAAAWALLRSGRGQIAASTAAQLLTWAAAAALAAALPLGLVIFGDDDWSAILQRLAPLVSLFGAPALVSGAMLWRRLSDPATAALRTAGTAVGVGGAAIMLGGLVVGWPHPAALLPVALLDFAALTAVAMIFAVPALHVVALGCLTMAYVMGVHLLGLGGGEGMGWIEQSGALARAMFSGTTAIALMPFGAALWGASELLLRRRRDDLHYCLIACGGVALLSIVLGLYHGFGRAADQSLAWMLTAYALAAGVAAWRGRQVAFIWTGALLLLLAMVQWFVFHRTPPVYFAGSALALLTLASVALAASVAFQALGRWRDEAADMANDAGRPHRAAPTAEGIAHDAKRPRWATLGAMSVRDLFTPTLQEASLVAVALAVMVLAAGLIARQDVAGGLAGLALRVFWISGLWLALSLLRSSAGLLTACQVAMAAGAAIAATAAVETSPWFAAARYPWHDARTIQAQGLAVTAVSLLWLMVRLALRPRAAADGEKLPPRWRKLAEEVLETPWRGFDQILPYILVVVVAFLTVLALAPGVRAELGSVAVELAVPDAARQAQYGPGAWALIGTVALALIAGLWYRVELGAAAALTVLAGCIVAMAAAPWETQRAAASAWRWACAIVLVGGSIKLWCRHWLEPLAGRIGMRDVDQLIPEMAPIARGVLFGITIAPILLVTLYSAAVALAGGTIAGPYAQSWFARIGSAANYLVPLLLIAGTLVGHAWRERRPAYAFWGGLTLNLAVSLGYALSIVTAGGSMYTEQWVRLLQLNALAAGGFAILWLTALRLARGASTIGGSTSSHGLLAAYLGIVLTPLGAAMLAAALRTVFQPWDPPGGFAALGGGWGWLAWAASAAAALWLTARALGRLPPAALVATLASGGLLSAFAVGQTNADTAWLTLHAMLVAVAMAAWAVLLIGWGASFRPSFLSDDETSALSADVEQASRPPGALGRLLGWESAGPAITRWTALLGGIALLLSLRLMLDDPDRPAWSIAGLAALSLLAVGMSLWTLSSAWLYAAAILPCIAATQWWASNIGLFGGGGPLDLPRINIATLGAAATALLALEVWVLRAMREQAHGGGRWSVHHIALGVCLLGLMGVSGLAILADLASGTTPPTWPLWGAMAAVLVLAVASLWDIDSRGAVAAIYLAGLLAVVNVIDAMNLPAARLLCSLAIAAGAHALVAAFVFSRRMAIVAALPAAGIPVREIWPTPRPGWLGIVLGVQTALLMLLGLVLVVTMREAPWRLGVAVAAVAAATALGLVAAGPLESRLKRAALLAGAASIVLWGWSPLAPKTTPMLDRTVVLMLVLAAVTTFFAVGMVKLLKGHSAWTEEARGLVPLMGTATALTLVVVLAAEVGSYDPTLVETTRRAVPMSWLSIGIVAAALVLLAAAGIVCAAVPGRDPLNLPDRKRTAYVYGSELMLVLLFVHTKVCVPDLLNIGVWTRFWPLILLGLAFAGVGLSELFRRQGRQVLAEPLGNTAAFMPLLPIATFFLLSGTWKHQEFVPYAAVLFTAAAVYASLAWQRRSFAFGLLSALVGNAGLWYMLHRIEGLGFAQHPQLWLIPAALSVLVAAWLNRDRLSAQQSQAIRYACMLVIYVSSTADVWINGLDRAPWLPMVLAGLSIAGVLAGIALRIRSFLFLGTAFLLVAIGAMIRLAQLRVGGAWPWLVAGVVVAAGIFVILAMFEKKRMEMLKLLEQLKEWKG